MPVTPPVSGRAEKPSTAARPSPPSPPTRGAPNEDFDYSAHIWTAPPPDPLLELTGGRPTGSIEIGNRFALPLDPDIRKTAIIVASAFAMVLILVVALISLRKEEPAQTSPLNPLLTTSTTVGPFGPAVTPLAPSVPVSTPSTVEPPAPPDICTALKTLSPQDEQLFVQHVVQDPGGMTVAYDALLASAPPELLPDVKALGPITRKSVDLVHKRQITSEVDLQAWLEANSSPEVRDAWNQARQNVVASTATTCPA